MVGYTYFSPVQKELNFPCLIPSWYLVDQDSDDGFNNYNYTRLVTLEYFYGG